MLLDVVLYTFQRSGQVACGQSKAKKNTFDVTVISRKFLTEVLKAKHMLKLRFERFVPVGAIRFFHKLEKNIWFLSD